MLEDSAAFPALEMTQVQRDLPKLCQRVAREASRVEILSSHQGTCECVLISKAELDSLERALELLSNSRGVREMTAQLAQLAQCAEPVAAGA